MKIQAIKVQHLRIPMRLTFAQANNETKRSNSVILTITTQNGIKGYGESCPRTYVTGETIDSVVNDVRSINGQLMNQSFHTLKEIQELMTEQLSNQIGLSATCALELALLDAWGKENNISIITALKNHLKPYFKYGGVVPFGNIAKLEPLLRQFDFDSIKVKVNQDIDGSLQRIQYIQSIYGDQVNIRVDANCSWDQATATSQIPIMIDAGVRSFEQLFPKDHLQLMAEMTRIYGKEVTIMADESLCTYEDALRLVEHQICNGFNLKISKNGGIFNAMRIIELAEKYNITYQLGAHFGETSLLTMAGITLANAAPNIRYHEGGLGTILLKEDLTANSLRIDHSASISINSHTLSDGLGIEIDNQFLKNNSSTVNQQVELAYYITRPQRALNNTFWY